MADRTLREKGREMRRRLLGEATVERIEKTVYADPIMAKFAELLRKPSSARYGHDPGLDLKTRTLICVISDATNGRNAELKLHLRMRATKAGPKTNWWNRCCTSVASAR